MARKKLQLTQKEQEYEALLIAEFRAGKNWAFEVYFERFRPEVNYITFKKVKSREIAADIVTEVFVKLWQKREGFYCARAILAFLHVSAKNACLNNFRTQRHAKKYVKLSFPQLVHEQSKDTLHEKVLETERMNFFTTAIDTLPERQNLAFRLYLEGYLTKQIAKGMGITVQTVHNMRSVAISNLKSRLPQELLST